MSNKSNNKRPTKKALSSIGSDEEDGGEELLRTFPASYKLSKYDVMCGRNKISETHSGNDRFRDIINDLCMEYATPNLTREDRKKIITKVYLKVASHGGCFLKQDFGCTEFTEISRKYAREKIAHALRDAAMKRTPAAGGAETTKKKRRKKREEEVLTSSSSSSSSSDSSSTSEDGSSNSSEMESDGSYDYDGLVGLRRKRPSTICKPRKKPKPAANGVAYHPSGQPVLWVAPAFEETTHNLGHPQDPPPEEPRQGIMELQQQAERPPQHFAPQQHDPPTSRQRKQRTSSVAMMMSVESQSDGILAARAGLKALVAHRQRVLGALQSRLTNSYVLPLEENAHAPRSLPTSAARRMGSHINLMEKLNRAVSRPNPLFANGGAGGGDQNSSILRLPQGIAQRYEMVDSPMLSAVHNLNSSSSMPPVGGRGRVWQEEGTSRPTSSAAGMAASLGGGHNHHDRVYRGGSYRGVPQNRQQHTAPAHLLAGGSSALARSSLSASRAMVAATAPTNNDLLWSQQEQQRQQIPTRVGRTAAPRQEHPKQGRTMVHDDEDDRVACWD